MAQAGLHDYFQRGLKIGVRGQQDCRIEGSDHCQTDQIDRDGDIDPLLHGRGAGPALGIPQWTTDHRDLRVPAPDVRLAVVRRSRLGLQVRGRPSPVHPDPYEGRRTAASGEQELPQSQGINVTDLGWHRGLVEAATCPPEEILVVDENRYTSRRHFSASFPRKKCPVDPLGRRGGIRMIMGSGGLPRKALVNCTYVPVRVPSGALPKVQRRFFLHPSVSRTNRKCSMDRAAPREESARPQPGAHRYFGGVPKISSPS
ncbi:MAG: hypothetical protein QG608_2979 [Actinomycetota bacterium]|nr:hypothetical protein [Actinomycetota bacterium]